MIISTPPLEEYPSGIFAITIHQITGLEFEQVNKRQAEKDEGNDMAEGSGDLPSSYCTVILNHQKIFKTRTKPKNAKPFFNAGTERMIRDWRTTEVMISVRDSRVHENDPLLGMIYLPLGKILSERSQVMESYPLVGGVGYGRARISMVFRSVGLQLPKTSLGWDYGTIRIAGPITCTNLTSELEANRIKLRTSVNYAKMYWDRDGEGRSMWREKRNSTVHLAVRNRYCSNIVMEFRKTKTGKSASKSVIFIFLSVIMKNERIPRSRQSLHGNLSSQYGHPWWCCCTLFEKHR